MLTVSAYAKINLTLEVLGKRDDEYHQISSVIQTIDLADTISFEKDDVMEVRCPDKSGIRKELLQESILTAANLLRDETNYSGGAVIQLDKLEIPRACGLGSSSTDSAAVLKGLNELWSLNLSVNDLVALASKLGSDTPFFIRGGTALIEGRGEEITPLPSPNSLQLVVIIPGVKPFRNKTAEMYQSLNKTHFSNGSKSNRMVFDLLNQKRFHRGMIYNAFENVAGEKFDGLEACRKRCEQAGLIMTHLAGSGPALFSLITEDMNSSIVLEKLAGLGMEAYLVNTI